uniref:Uncharacterized protein n=1 Tax=Tanacetum cinerariifolium TaxID=118510 RepID=A0A6L2MYQ7_TANCI|nr:hypothetical protein [Tanacetum cinerariifolium]
MVSFFFLDIPHLSLSLFPASSPDPANLRPPLQPTHATPPSLSSPPILTPIVTTTSESPRPPHCCYHLAATPPPPSSPSPRHHPHATYHPRTTSPSSSSPSHHPPPPSQHHKGNTVRLRLVLNVAPEGAFGSLNTTRGAFGSGFEHLDFRERLVDGEKGAFGCCTQKMCLKRLAYIQVKAQFHELRCVIVITYGDYCIGYNGHAYISNLGLKHKELQGSKIHIRSESTLLENGRPTHSNGRLKHCIRCTLRNISDPAFAGVIGRSRRGM